MNCLIYYYKLTSSIQLNYDSLETKNKTKKICLFYALCQTQQKLLNSQQI